MSLRVVLATGLALIACGGDGAGVTDGGDGATDANVNDPALTELVIAPRMLHPTFDPEATAYAVDLPLAVEAVTVTPTARSGGVTIRVAGEVVASGASSSPVAVALGATEIIIEVTASAGAVRTYSVTCHRGAGILERARLDTPITDFGDSFGTSLALDGDTLVVGAYREDSIASGIDGDQVNDDAIDAGAVYVFVRTGDAWNQEAYLKASNSDAGDFFGYDVALEGDTLAVGAWRESSAATGPAGDEADDSAQDAGAAYVFVRSGTTWTQQAYLKASNTDAGDHFGISVAMSGEVLAIGAHTEASAATLIGGDQADDSATDAGAVYVFRRSGTAWTQEAYVKPSNLDAGDGFGQHVELDGDTLVVGAPFEDSAALIIDGDEQDDSAFQAGAAYVFVRSGDVWTQQAYLKASNTDIQDWFGDAIALSGDTVVVGAPLEDSAATGIAGDEDDESADAAGAAYVFVRSGATWTQEAYLKASNADAGDVFGNRFAIDGDVLAVSAHLEDSAAVGVGGDETDDTVFQAGAAYLFVRRGTAWSQEAYVKASDVGENHAFGIGLALDAGLVAIGAPAAEAVHVFE